jgi:hypothetical protein
MFKKMLAESALCALTLGVMAQAAPVVATHSSNVGITDFDFAFDAGTNTITLNEIWGASGPGVLVFRGLEADIDYTVVKNVTNNTGIAWVSVANELLDPYTFLADLLDPAQPDWVPDGFSTSHNLDGLSFGQTANPAIPRTSITFSDIVVDENTHNRDFIDFFGGVVSGAGGTDTMTFGLSAESIFLVGQQQPFLLFQRPNERSDGSVPGVPEPATISLLGLSLLAVGVIRKRRQQS